MTNNKPTTVPLLINTTFNQNHHRGNQQGVVATTHEKLREYFLSFRQTVVHQKKYGNILGCLRKYNHSAKQ